MWRRTKRRPQLVESRRAGGGNVCVWREGRAGREGKERKGGRCRGPESGNGAALRHSDTRAHVKWRVHARGSSLLRTIRASFFPSTALFFSCHARAFSRRLVLLLRPWFVDLPAVCSRVDAVSLVEETDVQIVIRASTVCRLYGGGVWADREWLLLGRLEGIKERGFVPRGWLPPPRGTPVARINAVFYKLLSHPCSFRVHGRCSVCQVFEIYSERCEGNCTRLDADCQSVFTARNDRRIRRGSVVILCVSQWRIWPASRR